MTVETLHDKFVYELQQAYYLFKERIPAFTPSSEIYDF